jgi:hypothetical protein
MALLCDAKEMSRPAGTLASLNESEIKSAAWSPFGGEILLVGGKLASIHKPGCNEVDPLFEVDQELLCCDWSSSGEWIACSDVSGDQIHFNQSLNLKLRLGAVYWPGKAHQRDTRNQGQALVSLPTIDRKANTPISRLSWSPGGYHVVSEHDGYAARASNIWGDHMFSFGCGDSLPTQADKRTAWSPDGSALLVCFGGTATVWDIHSCYLEPRQKIPYIASGNWDRLRRKGELAREAREDSDARLANCLLYRLGQFPSPLGAEEDV